MFDFAFVASFGYFACDLRVFSVVWVDLDGSDVLDWAGSSRDYCYLRFQSPNLALPPKNFDPFH